MNKALLGFAFGITVGALVATAIVEEKYRKIAEEEIEAMKNYYKNKEKNFEELQIKHNQDKMFDAPVTDADIKFDFPKIPEDQYKKIVEDMGYTNEEMEELLHDPSVSVEQTEDGDYEIYIGPEERNEPYTISPEEFDEIPEYDCECLTYYSDCVLTNEDDEVIKEPYSIIGDALNHFGEYEDDSVFVRNDSMKCDYEIIKYDKPFGEIYGSEIDD